MTKALTFSQAKPINRSGDRSRWFLLLLLSMTTFGSLFAYDTVRVLQSSLTQALNIEKSDWDFLNDIAVIPNMIFPLISGFIIDKFGIRPTFLVFSVLVAIGQILVTLGVSNSSYNIMIAGRLIFGLSYQSQYVAKSVLVTRWARKTEVALALSLSAFLSRLGSSFNILASPGMYQGLGLVTPFLVGLLLIFTQTMVILVVLYADKKSSEAGTPLKSDEIKPYPHCSFSKSFYILAIACAISSGIFDTFYINGSDFLKERFAIDEEKAGELLNVAFGISAIGLPIFGYIADKVPKKLYILPGFAVLLIIASVEWMIKANSTEGQADFITYTNLCFYGLFYASFFAVLWSCIPFVTIPSRVGMVAGITVSLSELATFFLPEMFEWVHDHTLNINSGYFYSMLSLSGLGVLLLLLTVWLLFEDSKMHNVLNRRASLDGDGTQGIELSVEDKFMRFENDNSLPYF